MITRSGLKSSDWATTPPRFVRTEASFVTTVNSPNLFVGPTTWALSSSTRMPSIDSQ